MKATRLYTGVDGQSHFDDTEMETGKLQPGDGIVFREGTPDTVNQWHRAPRRQYVINLSGETEIEIGDGTKRRFGSGDILFVEDTSGQGHISRDVGIQPRRFIFIPVK
jgi:uncharacterized cupin superfamily protein